MKILISERLSQNKYKTPEGYLVCVDAILSRTGKQQYQKRELFQDCQDSEADMIIDVDRSDKEVFSEQSMASFENKPVTIEHPSEYVTPDNFNELSVGYLRDIHKGMYEGKPVMLGTLVLTNVEAIEKVESGELTNLSCGYDAECIETTSGYEFVNIRGNHLALCETPRAGITHIVDSVVNDVEFKHLTDSDKVDEFLQYGHGLQLEDDSIAFYEELKERFPEHATTIQDIIDEELKHVGQLNELREKINSRINKEINAGKQEAIKEDAMRSDVVKLTTKVGIEKVIYALQSDADKNLYFYIGKTFAMKDGAYTHNKYELNEFTPKQVRDVLLRTGWHLVSHGLTNIIDASNVESKNKIIAEANDSSADADKLLRKLRKEFKSGDILADDELEIICKQAHINTSAIQDLVAVGKLKEHGSNSYMIKDSCDNKMLIDCLTKAYKKQIKK